MDKQKTKASRFSVVGYILFLLPLSAVVGFGILIYDSVSKTFNNQTITAIWVLAYIIFTTLCFSLIDMIRRKKMVEEPTIEILEATQKIASGNFKVRLIPKHSYYRYDEYDSIMENINTLAEELSKSEILKTDFISNVSHELKTPLAVIQTYAKALHDGKLDKETKEKYLTTLVKTSQRLSNLISNVLKLNKLENQTLDIEKKPVNITDILSETILQFEDKIESKKIDLNCDLSDITINTEASLMEIIFGNLISNAIKFTDKNGKINISLKRNAGFVLFSVQDNGLGISKETGSRIFEKFYQGDTSHAGEGNGLGLSLVKKVIDILGGEISVKSQEGKGSTFIVKLKKD